MNRRTFLKYLVAIPVIAKSAILIPDISAPKPEEPDIDCGRGEL